MPKKGKKAKGKELRPSRLAQARFYLLLFLLATQPLVFSPWNTEYGYAKTIYTLVLGSILLVLWAVEAFGRREISLELSWLSPILPALVVAALLSLTGKTPACVVLQSAAVLLFFGLIYIFILNAPEQRQGWLLGALLFSAFLNALFGLLQYLAVVPGGPAGRGPGAMIATMGNQQFLAGFLSYLVFPGLILLRAKRAWPLAALVVGFNFAVMLLIQQVGVRLGLGAGLIFISFGLGFWNAGVTKKLVLAGVLALAALGGVLGFSGLWAGLALAGAAVGLYFLGRAIRRWPLLWASVAATAVAAVVLLLPVTTPIPAVRELWERKSGAIRAWDWWVGYEMWKDFPLFGIGLGGYKIYFVPYKPQFLATPRGAAYAFPFPRADQAHNEYVQVAAELGTFGLVVFLLGLGLLVFWGWRRLGGQRDPEKRVELLLLGGGLITTLVHAGPTFPFHLPASSLAFVAILGLAFSPRYGPRGDLRVSWRGPRKWIASDVSLLLALAVGAIAGRDIAADGYLLSAQVAYNLGRLDLAEREITRAVRLDFCPRISLYWYGLILARAGKLAEARDALRACLTRYQPEGLYLNLAAIHLQLGEVEEARRLLAELLATVPPADMAKDAQYYLAVAALRSGDLLGGKSQLEELVRQDPSYERAWLLLGEIARRRYLWDEAKAAFQKALAIINSKLERIESRLSQPLPVKEYGELQVQKAALTEMRAQALKALAELP